MWILTNMENFFLYVFFNIVTYFEMYFSGPRENIPSLVLFHNGLE